MQAQQVATIQQFSYLAGVIDATGAIGVRRGRIQMQPYIVIRHPSLDFVRWVSNTLGFGAPFHYGGRYYACQCFDTERVCAILTACLEFLVCRKELATLVLTFCESRLRSRYNGLTVNEVKLLQRIAKLSRPWWKYDRRPRCT